MQQSKFTSHDGKVLALYTWDKVTNPIGAVKICHGMAEHSARYDEFASFLNSRGFVVVANDHRGHGLTADIDSLGYEEGDMFQNNVKDQVTILQYMQDKYKLPTVLFGHSYGSFVTQAVMERENVACGYVLCGSNYIKGLQYKLCGTMSNYLCKHKGPRVPAQTIVNLSFKQYEKRFRGKNNWLSANADNVETYNQDALCGFVCSANFYRSFMNGIDNLYEKKSYINIDRTKPVLLIAGKDDPVGEYGKGVNKLYKFYRNKVKVNSVECRIYAGQRHEILNEEARYDTMDFVAEWLCDVLDKQKQ